MKKFAQSLLSGVLKLFILRNRYLSLQLTAILAVAHLFMASSISQAQRNNAVNAGTRDTTASTLLPWDVSLDIYQLFKSGNPSILVRRASNGKGAYRFVISGGISKNTINGLDSITHQKLVARERGLEVRSGYEWHRNRKRHQFFYGIEISYSFNSHKTSFSRNVGPQFVPQRYNRSAVMPFLGFKYRILNHLSLSAETNLNFSYSILKNLNPITDEVEVSAHSVGFGLNAFRAINISYHF